MLRFLGRSLVILCCTLYAALSIGYSASAVSSYDNAYQTVDSLDMYKQNYYGRTCSPTAVDVNPLLNDPANRYASDSGNSGNYQYDRFLSVYNSGAPSAVSLVETSYDTNGIITQIHIGVSENGSNLIASFENNSVYLKTEDGSRILQAVIAFNPSGVNNCHINFYTVNSINGNYQGFKLSGYVSQPYTTATYNYYAEITSVTYPTGYQGNQIRLTPNTDKSPHGALSVDGNEIYFALDPSNLPLDDQTGVKYQLYNDTDKLIDETSSKFMEGGGSYTFVATLYGNYRLEVSFYAPIPYQPLSDDWHTLKLPVIIDGTTYTVTSQELGCDDTGTCENPENISCDTLYPDAPLDRAFCNLSNKFDFGIINPAILSVRGLVNSLTVSKDPKCSSLLPDFTYNNKTFPLSDYIPDACYKAEQLRQNLPIISVASNFVIAVMFISFMARVINMLMDHRQHDVVVGV